jgi:MFS family permease
MPENSSSVLSVLRHRTFAIILFAAAISNIGNWMESVAQAWAVVQQTHDDPAKSAFMTELLSVADFGPVLLLSLIGGVITDRVNRKVWLFILQLAACLLGSTLAVIGYMDLLTPWRVIALTFAEGIVWALNGPVWMSVVPQLVPREELQFATAANSMQFNLARLVGPVIAGFVISMAGVKLAFAINAATFIPVLIALTCLPDIPRPASSGHQNLFHEMTAGVRFVLKDRGARQLAIMSMIFTFLSAPLQGLLAIIAHQVLGGDSALYGGMLAMIGLGSIVGALSLGKIPGYYPRHHLIPLSMCLFSTFALLYSFSHSIPLSLPLLFCCGIFWLLTLNPLNTAVQLLATDEQRGRIMSVMMLCSQGAMPVGHLCAGALAHVMSPENILRYMFAVLLLFSMFFLFSREPAIDQMQDKTARSESLFAAVREAITAQSHVPTEQDSVRIPRPGSFP